MRSGHDAATSRAVAEEVGFADSVLWHYFLSFDDVVQSATREIGTRTLDRIDRATAGTRGLRRVEALMAEVLPLTKVTRDEAAVVVGFWGRLATRGDLRSSTRYEQEWSRQLNAAIGEAIEDGELRSETPTAGVLVLLRSVIYGQQVVQVVKPETTAEEHNRVLNACLEPWRTDAAEGA